jgi:hypothetical protein
MTTSFSTGFDLSLAMSLVAHDRGLERFIGDDVVPCDNLTVQYNRGTRRRILLVGILGRCLFNYFELRAEFSCRPTGGFQVRRSALAHGVVHIKRDGVSLHFPLLLIDWYLQEFKNFRSAA